MLNRRAAGKRIALRSTSANILLSFVYHPVAIHVNISHLNLSNHPQCSGIKKLRIPAHSKYLGYQPESPQSTSHRFPVVSSMIMFRGARSWWVNTRPSGLVGSSQLFRCSSGLFTASLPKDTKLHQKLTTAAIVPGDALGVCRSDLPARKTGRYRCLAIRRSDW